MASGEIGPEGGCLSFTYEDDDDVSFLEEDLTNFDIADSENESDDSVECDSISSAKHSPVKKRVCDSSLRSRLQSDSVQGAIRCKKVPKTRRKLRRKVSVKFPRSAVLKKRKFIISPKVEEQSKPGYFPTSVKLACMPCENFDRPVDINLPIWCNTDDNRVEVEVRCQSKEGDIVVKTAKLRDLDNEISFQSSRFSSFMVWIKEEFLHAIKLSMNMDIWKSDHGNYVFVAYANDLGVKSIWKEDLKEKGYKPTQVTFNPVLVHHNDTIDVSFGIERFTPQRENFNIDIRASWHYLVNFVLPEISFTESNISLNCHVTQKSHHEKKSNQNFVIKKTWRENNTNVSSTAERDERIEDVFQNEVVQVFFGPTWHNFATSSHGLGLSSSEYDSISQDHRGNTNRMMMEILNRWRTKLEGKDSAAIIEVRKIADKFRETM